METDKAARRKCKHCDGSIIEVWGDWFHYYPLERDCLVLYCPPVTVAEPRMRVRSMKVEAE